MDHRTPTSTLLTAGPPNGVPSAEIGLVWDSIGGVVTKGYNNVLTWFQKLPGNAVAFIKLIPSMLVNLAGDFVTAGVSLGSKILDGIVSGISGAVSGVADIAKTLYNDIAGFINAHVIDPLKNISIGAFGFTAHPFSVLPDIPTLHSGGVFNSGAGEGLALLKDGEGVFTPRQMAALGARGGDGSHGTVINNFPAGVAPSVVAAAQARWNRRNGAAA